MIEVDYKSFAATSRNLFFHLLQCEGSSSSLCLVRSYSTLFLGPALLLSLPSNQSNYVEAYKKEINSSIYLMPDYDMMVRTITQPYARI